jgi:hypothetical protein
MLMRKPIFSFSFVVAVHWRFTPMKWQIRTFRRWKEMPEKKKARRGVQVMVCRKEVLRLWLPRRKRMTTYASGAWLG